jgi:hypothetical protein
MLRATVLSIALAFPGLVIQAQQPSTPEPSAQTQIQPVPCTPQALPKPLKDVHPSSRIQQLIDKERQRIQQQTGITPPSIDDLKKDMQNPCPAPATNAATKTGGTAGASSAVTPQPATLKLPPDTTVTLHCNPMTPSPKDGGARQTTLTLPDPHDFAVPRPNEFEADSVVPDLSAKTPCYLVKVDPKTNKTFVAQ